MKDRFNNAVGPQVRTKKKGPGKVIPVLAVLSIGGGLQAATQFFASDFKYQTALGGHFDHIYPPWKIMQWAVSGIANTRIPSCGPEAWVSSLPVSV